MADIYGEGKDNAEAEYPKNQNSKPITKKSKEESH
jgi:hypothetical protein